MLYEVITALGQRWKLRRYEVGAGAGIAQVFGDIGGTIDEANWYGLKDIKFDETRMSFPVYVRYRLDPVYSIKVNGIVGFGHGDDLESRNNRGRSYKIMLSEVSAQLEYYFLAEEKKYKTAAIFNRRGMLNNYMSLAAYGFVGIGGFYSHSRELIVPQERFYDDAHGSAMGAVIPFGIGTKYILSDRWVIGAELGYRFPFSDYVEGYTQTAASKHNDVYYFMNFQVAYRLETTRKGLPTFLDRDYRAASNRASSGKVQKKARVPRSARKAMQ